MFRFLRVTAAITEAELAKMFREPSALLSRAVQPILWLAIFGQVFSRVRGIPTGEVSYLAFMTPGVLAQSVLFSAIFYGIAVIWERDLGIVHKLLVTPARREALVLGKAISAGLRGLVQASIIYVVALLMHVELRWEVSAIAGVATGVVLGSATFSTFSLIIACIVKTRERFMGIGQVLTMPLFFASNAIYPLEIMPEWLKWIARFNPLTYLVDLLRGLMIVNGHSIHSAITNCGVLLLTLVVFILIAARLYPSLVK
ncbi:MAG: ABC transporter permease [Formivibrio sp.]|nr:ABC transporter permease [Formivibrio sp.]